MTPNHGLEYPKCVVTQKGYYLLRRQIFISIYGAYRRVTGCDNYARAPRSWPWNQQYTYIYTTQSIPPPPSWRQSACPVPSLSSQCQAQSSFNHRSSIFLAGWLSFSVLPPFFLRPRCCHPTSSVCLKAAFPFCPSSQPRLVHCFLLSLLNPPSSPFSFPLTPFCFFH